MNINQLYQKPAVCEPITCTGHELFAVIADLEARGMFPWRLDAAVGSKSGYRVHYCERKLVRKCPEKPPPCPVVTFSEPDRHLGALA